MPVAKPTTHDATRERLLDEAEKLFAEKGYNAVSVREITKAAGSNLAAVNYHFGSKENLYLAVFRDRWRARAEKVRRPMEELARQEKVTPRQVVRTLAQAFLRGPLTAEERLRHSQLIAREMASPGKAFDLLAEGQLKPAMEQHARLLQRALPYTIAEERLKLIVLSIFSQVLHFNFARPVVSLVTGRSYDAAFIEELIEHITDFALRGLGLEETA
ncbi:MAG: CerR family C-terminal domain-containing protein [Thermodesulfobacteriota bacterium]